MKKFRENWRGIVLCVLALGNFFLWYAVAAESRDGILTLTFLDVGQGDATLIEGPRGVQVLIDGGKGKRVLSELSSVMPFYDRSVDVIVATHPDQDHIEGLLVVARRYENLLFISPDLETDKPFDVELRELVAQRGVQMLAAREGQRLEIGGGAVLTVLFPDQDVSGWQKDTNMASVVALLEYGKHKFLFTGDSPAEIEEYLVRKLGGLDVDVLKAGHHGSRTSSSKYFLSALTPQYAIISAGRGNSYGHPHKEVLDNLAIVGAEIFRTDESGRITVTSDGATLKIEN